MTKKQRLLLLWSLFSAAVLGAGVWLSVAALRPPPPPPRTGLLPGLTDSLAASIPTRAPFPRFEALPLAFRHFGGGARTHRLPEDMGPGLAVADLDGDDCEDLVLVQSAPLGSEPAPCEVWRGDGRGGFARAGTGLPALHGLGVALGDADGDADLDLYLTGFGRNVLLRNDGDLVFTDVTAAAGVEGGGFSTGACWGDADGDGDLDLYVTRYVVHDGTVSTEPSRRGSLALPASLNPSAFAPATNLLYRNEGGLRFQECAAALGVADPHGKGMGAVFADLDQDGLLDLYVANDVSDNVLLRGRRGQPFEDVTHPSCAADPLGAMGLAVGDYDGDADLDLFITHWQTEENLLLEKLPHGLVFRDASVSTGLGPPGRGRVGWATDFGDVDNDGFADVFVVNGSTFEQADDRTQLIAQAPQLFWNDGERFFDLLERAGPDVRAPRRGRGGIVADLDRDGLVDWVVAVHGGAPLLWRNQTEGAGGYLVVEPRGRAPNPFAYGALVVVEAGGRRQAQQVGTKVSYLSAGPPALHFGLGASAQADRVTVRFPSGAVVERRGVPAGQRLVLAEVDTRALGARMDAAGDALAAGRSDEARRLLRAVIEDDPRHAGALYRLALLSERDEALALLQRVAYLEPTSARALLQRAKVLSDLRRPHDLDLAGARSALERGRRINPNETGALQEEGRVLLLSGEVEAAARLLERGVGNPRTTALAALCWIRAGDLERAARLLGRPPGQGPPHAEEGDTATHKLGQRDLLARLLDLGPDARWRTTELPLVGGAGAPARLTDVDGDGALDAVVGEAAVRLRGTVPGEVQAAPPTAAPARTSPPPAPAAYDLEAAAAFALDPPATVTADPPGATAVVEADLDGDGDRDRVVACGGDDPGAPLPWWGLLREGDVYRLVRGSLPVPGFRVSALAAADLDGDGRAEVLLAGGGRLPGDTGRVVLVALAAR